MRLSTKYVFGMGALGILFLSPVFTELGEYSFIVLGFGIMIVGISFYYLLFAKETIRGYNLEFEVSPDLTHFEITKRHSGEKTNKEVIIPETAFCAACGNEVYKPFRCQTCGQLLCGKHYLRGDHRCVEERL
ncbi:MAG: AN1-type zinc finger protein [Candidatus Hodarchaeales archaeon]